MSILLNICLAIFVLVAVLMIFVILMQRPKSEGLGAAFGGGVTDNIFGAQTTNVLTKITGWLAGIFFFLTFALSVMYAHQSGGSGSLRRELMKADPAAAAAPASIPAESPAVGAPGSVTNPAPSGPATAPVNPQTPADQAVGAVSTAPVQTNQPESAPANSVQAPSSSAQPQPTQGQR